MEKINLRENPSIKKDIESLYNSAFPEDERPPFSWTYEVFNKTEESFMIGYYKNNEFIGYIHYVIYLDILYIAFFAISKNKRNQGYGTQILNDIKESYPFHTLLLCFEEVNKKYPDLDNRIKRKKFYETNGYINNNLKTQEGDVVYQSAYNGSMKVNYQEYQQIFDLVYGKDAHKTYLKQVK